MAYQHCTLNRLQMWKAGGGLSPFQNLGSTAQHPVTLVTLMPWEGSKKSYQRLKDIWALGRDIFLQYHLRMSIKIREKLVEWNMSSSFWSLELWNRVECDPLINANPARKATEMIIAKKWGAESAGAHKSSSTYHHLLHLITSYTSYIILLPCTLMYPRGGPGAISILKRMNEGRALRQLHGKRLSFIDYLS